MRNVRFGLVGCGAMGNVIVGHVLKRWAGRARWTGLHDVSAAAARALCQRQKVRIAFKSLEALISGVDWVVEAASAAAVPRILRLCLAKKRNLIVMSTGGLLTCASLLRKVAKSEIRVIVPSGAIAGLDAIKAASLGKISEATITTRKPPRALEGAPYLKQRGIPVSDLVEEKVVFEGNALEAMKGFPANINVAATLALASGLGPKKTRVKIVADPKISRNIHQVVVAGSSGELTTLVENVPSARNPKTSELAVLAACAAIDSIFLSVRMGT